MMPRSSIGTKKKSKTEKPSSTGPARKSRPTVARSKVTTIAAKTDAVSILRADHTKMRRLLAELQSAEKPAQRQRLLAQVTRELEIHTTIEEEIFYPAFRAASQTRKDQQRFHEATAEHHAAEVMLREVASADDATEEFPGRAKVLKEVVEHHAGEEERDMFPRARELIGVAALRAIGEEMGERRRALLRGAAASTSTLQKMADFVTSSFSPPAKPTPGSPELDGESLWPTGSATR